jgi:hypothetical protein
MTEIWFPDKVTHKLIQHQHLPKKRLHQKTFSKQIGGESLIMDFVISRGGSTSVSYNKLDPKSISKKVRMIGGVCFITDNVGQLIFSI